ncbi:Pre-mRNA splicing Prp18-interacting factor-domain-containing protein [Cryomyces antarcticus]
MPPAQPKKPADVSAAAKERNEYIPNFISKKPFYITDDLDTSGADYLEHQRLQKQEQDSKWYDRGKKKGPAATKFRKGACENCGAMTHKKKDCLARPRKQGAKWTGKDIQADEIVQDVQLGFDAKRDRWNGYDASEYNNVVEEYNALEELKKQVKGSLEAQRAPEDGDPEEEDADTEGAKYDEETDMGRKQATSTRNLRLREDTAKYLLNLDLDSAHYDPKTRSMLDPGASTTDASAALVAEEGFQRASGDAAEFERATRYAWETQERGDKNKIHLQANPTSGEFFRKKEAQESEARRAAHKQALLEKYGGREHLSSATLKDAAAAVVENERYVEYDERGMIKGVPVQKAKSKYPEDVFINNHTSVWGSWWCDFKWGYACCQSTIKNSYCTGEEGIRAFNELDMLKSGVALSSEQDTRIPETEQREIPRALAWKEEQASEEHIPNAVDNDEKTSRDAANNKRTLHEMKSGVTEEEMDDYRRKRTAVEDPMAKFLGKDELVH